MQNLFIFFRKLSLSRFSSFTPKIRMIFLYHHCYKQNRSSQIICISLEVQNFINRWFFRKIVKNFSFYWNLGIEQKWLIAVICTLKWAFISVLSLFAVDVRVGVKSDPKWSHYGIIVPSWRSHEDFLNRSSNPVTL